MTLNHKVCLVSAVLFAVTTAEVRAGHYNQRGYAVSEGADGFAVRLLGLNETDPAQGGGDIFFNSLDWDPASQRLFGLSWDELYRIDPLDGETERLGPIREYGYSHSFFAFNNYWTSTDFLNGTEPGAEKITYSIELIITFSGHVDMEEVVFEEQIHLASCSFDAPFQDQDITLLSIDYSGTPPGGIPRTATIVVTARYYNNDSWVHIDFTPDSASGGSSIAISGIVKRKELSQNPNSSFDHFPMMSLTVAPDGHLIGLSDQWYDISNHPTLYELVAIEGDAYSGMEGTIPGSQHVIPNKNVALDTRGIDSIEWGYTFSGEACLYGYGNGTVYQIDPETGICLPTVSIDLPLTDMDATPNGLLKGLYHPDTGSPEFIGMNHPATVVLDCPECASIWGMASLLVTRSDIDRDWGVDLDDFILLSGCLEGPVQPATPECRAADINQDGAVDLSDFAELQADF